MSDLRIEPMAATLGAVVTGVRLAALDEADWPAIEAAFHTHSLYYSQARLGIRPETTALANARLGGRTTIERPATETAPLRPLVKLHPVTGRTALFIGRHAYGIPGLDLDASTALLDDLLDAACRPPRVVRHRWSPGDLVVWDNRCVLHRARPYDPTEARVMVHTRVAGDVTERADALLAPPVI